LFKSKSADRSELAEQEQVKSMRPKIQKNKGSKSGNQGKPKEAKWMPRWFRKQFP
jgi:hypothetical protein